MRDLLRTRLGVTAYYLDADGPLKVLLKSRGRDAAHTLQLEREAKAMSRFLRGLAAGDYLLSSHVLRVEIVRTLSPGA